MAKLQNLTINDTGALTLPTGTIAQRTAQASTLVSFTTVGTTTWICPAGVYSVEVLVVAGGGGGGRHSGGGGGGGGVIYRPAHPVVPGTTYTVTVGAGGNGPPIGSYPTIGGGTGTNGGNSVFGTLTAIGGGAGGWNSANGAAGGSGGGGTGHATYGGGAGTLGQGFNGGPNGYDGVGYASSGGGGAGGPGQKGVGSSYTYITYNAQSTTGFTKTIYPCGGAGGPGVFYNITGQERAYGGGGGGNIQYGGAYAEGGAGGSGVGGDGSAGDGVTEGSQYGYDGLDGYGGGGGGSHYNAPATATAGRAGKGGSGCVHIRYNSDNSLGSTTGSIRSNSQRGMEFKDGGGVWQSNVLPFLQRTIITNHYVGGGYKDGTPWQNVNRTVAATDTTTNLGDLMSTPSNYKNGAVGKNIMYFFGATATNAGASNAIIAFNMRTEASYTSAGSTTLTGAVAYNGVCFKEHYAAYIHQGNQGAAIDEFNMQTETLIGTIGTTIFADTTWSMSHENHGLFYASDNNTRVFHFATKTPVTRTGTHPSAHHQQKAVNTKLVNCYAGNEGTYNAGNNFRKTNMVTDITSGTIAKPVTNSGEENYTMGQDHQYMLGMYNGLQNNISWKFIYSSETGTTGGSTLEPKGHAGMSSAIAGWRD